MRYLFLLALATSILFMSLVNTGFAAPVDQDLVLYYSFDEGKGDKTKDLSGNGNEGTLNGGVEWVDGKFSKALQFDGKDSYVDCGNADSLKIEKEITLAAWINPMVPPSQLPSDSRVIARENSGAGAPWASYGLTVNGGATNMFAFEISADTADVYPKSTTLPVEGTWSHVAGVYDGSKCDIYVNGVLENSLPQTGNLVINPDLGTMVGADVNRNIEYFQGIIDEIVIYSRVLSTDEIEVLANKPFNEVMSIESKGKLAVLWGNVKIQ